MKQEDKAGLYTTVIIHLAVLIVLLATSLGFSIQRENSFVLDFSKLEELERLQAEVERLRQEAEFQQAISQRLEAELGAAGGYRNIAVDRASLKDDRGTDAEQLYKDAERLARELKGGFEAPDDGFTANVPSKDDGNKKEEKKYSGPSVVSYFLDSRLPLHGCRAGYGSYQCGQQRHRSGRKGRRKRFQYRRLPAVFRSPRSASFTLLRRPESPRQAAGQHHLPVYSAVMAALYTVSVSRYRW